MKKIVAVSDIHEISRSWKYLIEMEESYIVGAYVTGRKDPPELLDEIPVINYEQFCAFYKKGVFQKLILPRERLAGYLVLISKLKRYGVEREDILLTSSIESEKREIIEYDKAGYLPYLEFHVADQCNLNCKGCEHYSGLVKGAKFHDVNSLRLDLLQLKKFIQEIGRIRILGGEPLLHPELGEILKITRDVYPKSYIVVVTNGLLIKRMGHAFWKDVNDNNVEIQISHYPELIGKENEIIRILEENNVTYHLSPLMSSFRIKYTLEPQENAQQIFDQCFQAHCNNLYEGKMGACFLPFTTQYFNSTFGTNLPVDGAIDLYDESLTTEKLKRFLQSPFERCKYCKTDYKLIPWGKIGKENRLQDWIWEYN